MLIAPVAPENMVPRHLLQKNNEGAWAKQDSYLRELHHLLVKLDVQIH